MSSYRLLSDCGYWGSVCRAIRKWLRAFKFQQYISVWLHKINLQRAEPTDGAATFDSTHSRENKSRRSHQSQSLTVPNRLHVNIHHTPDWRLFVSSQIEHLHTVLSILKSALYERSCWFWAGLWIKTCSSYIKILKSVSFVFRFPKLNLLEGLRHSGCSIFKICFCKLKPPYLNTDVFNLKHLAILPLSD